MNLPKRYRRLLVLGYSGVHIHVIQSSPIHHTYTEPQYELYDKYSATISMYNLHRTTIGIYRLYVSEVINQSFYGRQWYRPNADPVSINNIAIHNFEY